MVEEKKKRQYKRRYKYKKRSFATKKERIPYLPSLQPKQCWIKLRYVDSTTLTSTAGAVVNQQYNIASMYDPDYTYVGHQPYTWDTLSTLFNAYCVKSCKVKVKTVACTIPMRMNVVPKFNSSSISTTLSLVEEYPNSSNLMIGTEGTERTFYYNLPKLAGSSWDAYKKDSQAVPTASPSASTYLNFSVRSADLVSTATLALDIEFEFLVLMSQPLVQAQS